MRAAIATGYTKGFHTIVDANAVTAITALILFMVATAGREGLRASPAAWYRLSIVTAVSVTRALLALLAGFRWFDNPPFMGASRRPDPALAAHRLHRQAAPLVHHRRRPIALSLASRSSSRGSTSGSTSRAAPRSPPQTPQPAQIERLPRRGGEDRPGRRDRSRAAAKRSETAASGSSRSAPSRSRRITSSGSQRRSRALRRDIRRRSATSPRASASRSLRQRLYAMFVSFLLIAIYITIRFQWQFAVPILRRSRTTGSSPSASTRSRAGGVGRDGRCVPDHPRVLDLRHDHHLRPHPGEHPDHAAVDDRAHHQRLALGDDPALTGDDVHHPAPGQLRCSSLAARRCRTSPSRSSSGSRSAPSRRSSSQRRSWSS